MLSDILSHGEIAATIENGRNLRKILKLLKIDLFKATDLKVVSSIDAISITPTQCFLVEDPSSLKGEADIDKVTQSDTSCSHKEESKNRPNFNNESTKDMELDTPDTNVESLECKRRPKDDIHKESLCIAKDYNQENKNGLSVNIKEIKDESPIMEFLTSEIDIESFKSEDMIVSATKLAKHFEVDKNISPRDDTVTIMSDSINTSRTMYDSSLSKDIIYKPKKNSVLKSNIAKKHKNPKPQTKKWNGKSLKCSQCSLIFYDLSELKSHYKKGHDFDRLPCEKCDKSFNDSATLRVHLKSSHQSLYNCDQCDLFFYDSMTLKMHCENIHQQVYTCDQCNYVALSLTGLNYHMQSKH